MRHLTLPGLALTLLPLGLGLGACGDKAGGDTGGAGSGSGGGGSEADVDGDGYTPSEGDCDDSVANVNPGAAEVCDELDNDCDGLVDMEDPDIADAGSWSVDEDVDGFGSSALKADGCEQPEGTVGNATDCDDGDAEINPDAHEVCDGIDNDCDDEIDAEDDSLIDGAEYYPDLDEDGFGEDGAATVTLCELSAGYAEVDGDCDDADGEIWPGAPEVCGDGIDSDCDGQEGVPSIGQGQDMDCVAAELFGGSASTGVLAGIGPDLTGSGGSTLVFGTEADTVHLVDAASGEVDIQAHAAATVVEASSGRELGAGLAWGDVTGDGSADLVLGAPYDDTANTNAGLAFVLAGPLSGTESVGSADAVVLGEAFGDRAGSALLAVGDQTGDGVADLLVAAPYYDEVINRGGAVYLVAGPVTGSSSLEDAAASYTGERLTYRLGHALAEAGDLDGDGHDDLLAGAPADEKGASDAGAVYGLMGPVASGSWTDTVRWYGETAGDLVGFSVAGPGDVDGDGYADVLVGLPGNDDNGPSAGAAWLALGPLSVDDDLDPHVVTTFIGEADADVAGTSVAADDLDGDGTVDFVIGAPRETSNPGPGRTFVVFGPATGTVDLQLADLTLEGRATGDRMGEAVSVGDHDGDGEADLLVSAPGLDTAGTDLGGAYLLLGGP